MIVLPNAGAAEEALRRTDGLKVGNTVINVERYNANQSIVAMRNARKTRANIWSGRGEVDYVNEKDNNDEPERFDADGEAQVKKEMPASARNVTSQILDSPVTPPRKVSKGSGISWAIVASGVAAEQHVPSPAPLVAEDTQQQTPSATRPFPALDGSASVSGSGYPRPSNGTGPSTRFPPPLKGTLTSPVAAPAKTAPASAHPAPADPPQIMLTPATTSLGLRLPLPQQPSSSATLPEGPTPMQGTQSQSSESSQVEGDSSRATQMPNIVQQHCGSLAMSTDTDAYIRNRHCADCAFCKMRVDALNKPQDNFG